MNAMKKNKQLIGRYALLIFGFAVIALGTTLTLYSELGMNPWGTFHQGVAKVTGLSFGTISQLTGLAVILFSLFFKIYPGVGTVLNMVMIGWMIDRLNQSGLIPHPTTPLMQYVYLIVGILLFNYGIYIYLVPDLGAGPRDGLMLGLVRMTGISVSIIRPMIEITVITIGVLLGGPLGIGTLLNGFGGGYVLNTIFKLHKYDPKRKQ